MNISLNKNWIFNELGSAETYFTDLPACSYTIYIKNNVIPDPFDKTNEKQLLWVGEKDYEFTKTFIVDENVLASEKVFLRFNGLDTIAEIYVNGALAGKGENAHMTHEFDVKTLLKTGANTLLVVLLSPLRYIREKLVSDPMPLNPNGIRGINHIRKPGCHFGWDWGPQLPQSGIESAEIITYGAARIADTDILQSHGNGTVTLSFKSEITKYSDEEIQTETVFEVFSPDGEKLGKASSGEELIIENPVLWWCNGATERKKQPLYKVSATLMQNGKAIDAVTKTIGLRTVELFRENGDFAFVLNGKRIFAKGANWIPIDSFPDRRKYADYEYYIRSAAECNMNMLRVWGGGYYANEDFMSLCDEYGILVWQDFCFACAPYPFYNDGFRENVLAEVKCNVNRLKHRASLAVFCGNNEIEAMSIAWKNRTKLRKWTELFFYGYLKDAVSVLAPYISYTPGSPVGDGYLKGVSDDKTGDTHLWQVWHGLRKLSYYRKRQTRFCSEYGLQSLPSLDAIKTFAEEKDYSMHSEVFNAHQKNGSGNDKMLYYMAANYNVPKNFTDLIYFTQLIQKTGVQDAAEFWRRNYPYCNGALYWQYNDCWPVNSWSSADYTGKFKPLQYCAKHFFSPSAVSLHDEGSNVDVYVLNDSIYDKTFTVKLVLTDFYGKCCHEEEFEAQTAANSAKKFKSVDCSQFVNKKELKNTVLAAFLYENGAEVNRKTLLFGKEKALALPKDKIDASVTFENGVSCITLLSKSYCRSVMLDLEGVSVPFDDNYFDLLPGEEKKVFIPADATGKLIVKHFAETECHTSKLKNFKLRLSILVKPSILLMAFSYLFI